MLSADFTLKDESELSSYFKEKGINIYDSHKIVATCGSGMTACVILAALERLGVNEKMTLYDGSWAEYGKTPQI